MLDMLPPNIILYIQEMGSFETKVRNNAISKLKTYLQESNVPSQVLEPKSLILIWKGLHTAMLRQDQALRQEALADDIFKIINSLKKGKTANKFVKAGLDTFIREWDRTNYYMKNKMLMFFRRLLRAALFRLADNKWEYSGSFAKMLEETVIKPEDDLNECPMDIKMHLSNIFLEELAKANDEYLSHKIILTLILPFIKVLALSKQMHYIIDVQRNVFEHLLRQSDVGIDNRADLLDNEIVVDKRGKQVSDVRGIDDELGLSAEENADYGDDYSDQESLELSEDEKEFPLDPRAGSVDVVLPQLAINYEAVASTLFEMSQLKTTSRVNSNRMRHIAQRFIDVLGGVFSISSHPSLYPVNDLIQADNPDVNIEEAIGRKMRLEEELTGEKYTLPKNFTKEDLPKHKSLLHKTKNVINKDKRDKHFAMMKFLEEKKKRRERRSFEWYAKRTAKMNKRMERRRLMAQGFKNVPDEIVKRQLKEQKMKKKATLESIDTIVQKHRDVPALPVM